MPLRQDGTERKMPFARNTHPTVKPTDLMRWLVRLVTPPGGLVLDPFMGSGSTGKACSIEGFRFLGIEREAEYVELSRARIAHACEVAAKGPEAVAAEAAGQLSLLDAP
ncbi:MAG: site-specific DNA-methyltransferase [Betaproteobacteria bacterium]|nr:site-specific DNA-methyltransferase [Betaproteobacteria bacterium]